MLLGLKQSSDEWTGTCIAHDGETHFLPAGVLGILLKRAFPCHHSHHHPLCYVLRVEPAWCCAHVWSNAYIFHNNEPPRMRIWFSVSCGSVWLGCFHLNKWGKTKTSLLTRLGSPVQFDLLRSSRHAMDPTVGGQWWKQWWDGRKVMGEPEGGIRLRISKIIKKNPSWRPRGEQKKRAPHPCP